MKAKLFCKTGILSGAKYDIGREATIGKEPGNSILLDTKIISGRHARIFFDEKEQAYFLEDLRSRNGTKLDGLPVTETEKLGDLHVITLADTFDFIFQLVQGDGQPVTQKEKLPPAQPEKSPEGKTRVAQEPFAAPAPPREEKTAAPTGDKTLIGAALPPIPVFKSQTESVVAPKSKPTISRPTFFLEIKRPGQEPVTFKLKEGENVVGRLAECDICVDDTSLSRQHAVVTVKSGKVTVRDLGSKNHTFAGDKEITSEVEIRLDTRLKFGAVEAHLIYKKGES
ncbi:MAG: FHA domain-containing protein [candidate division KSB1 bacterium]|nr:FHA domain-containing protein [candidate division KSB1 bacterium]MDZ7365393.1 FHA domain-containing protein [candidate division KSB1 bacterium]MDZ7403560.1 FHA domain-containing protein [candidate division KSB1 bacterium]